MSVEPTSYDRKLNLAYAAGLFDGEGCITYKKYKEKKSSGVYDCWRISMEVAMTDEATVRIFHEIVGVGTVNKKPRKNGHKMQWRWRCVFRDAFKTCLNFFEFSNTKLDKISQVINHYTSHKPTPENIIDLQYYKMFMAKKNKKEIYETK